jgi:hypothetical protein
MLSVAEYLDLYGALLIPSLHVYAKFSVVAICIVK